ncbi:cupin domain-containing protein [Priestia flexa]|uniref:cupin domain-containing protein n=1 Tax=Priestia flexa TaxID=86664 RepID=UPI000C233935|nr:cupin domain-containing protein [Priestia flexa]MEC0666440.1 cupin domain-containing protein [Priestia flexa]MED3822518.1 cupin domain-containing protein [Priestia flexa]
MELKKAFIKKGIGGGLEEVIHELLPKHTGYVEVQHDVAGQEHPSHTHPTDEILHIIKGSIYFTVEGEITRCEAGDRIYLPKHTKHASKADVNGCTYVISILKF